MPFFGDESEAHIITTHPEIQRVVRRAIKIYDFKVLCGLRNEQAQTQALVDKTSTVAYPESRHNRSRLPDGKYIYTMSDAIDIVPYPIKWPDMKTQTTREYAKRLGEFYRLAGIILMAAEIEGVKLRWGGDFKTLFDGPHFERIVA